MEVAPYFLNAHGRIAPWVDLFVQQIEMPLEGELITPTEDMNQIEQLNKSPQWKLKGVVA